jgi:hypothetical protein
VTQGIAWTTREPPSELRVKLDHLTPRIATWSPEVEWWATEYGYRFDA